MYSRRAIEAAQQTGQILNTLGSTDPEARHRVAALADDVAGTLSDLCSEVGAERGALSDLVMLAFDLADGEIPARDVILEMENLTALTPTMGKLLVAVGNILQYEE